MQTYIHTYRQTNIQRIHFAYFLRVILPCEISNRCSCGMGITDMLLFCFGLNFGVGAYDRDESFWNNRVQEPLCGPVQQLRYHRTQIFFSRRTLLRGWGAEPDPSRGSRTGILYVLEILHLCLCIKCMYVCMHVSTFFEYYNFMCKWNYKTV